MVLESTQPVTEISTGSISWGVKPKINEGHLGWRRYQCGDLWQKHMWHFENYLEFPLKPVLVNKRPFKVKMLRKFRPYTDIRTHAHTHTHTHKSTESLWRPTTEFSNPQQQMLFAVTAQLTGGTGWRSWRTAPQVRRRSLLFFTDVMFSDSLWPWEWTQPLTEMSTRDISWR